MKTVNKTVMLNGKNIVFEVLFDEKYTGDLSLQKTVSSMSGDTEYDPFGNVVLQTGSLQQAYLWSSKENDGDGLVYYLYRFYNPILGRWTNRDTIGIKGEFNVNAFLHNIPTTLVDLYGDAEGTFDVDFFPNGYGPVDPANKPDAVTLPNGLNLPVKITYHKAKERCCYQLRIVQFANTHQFVNLLGDPGSGHIDADKNDPGYPYYDPVPQSYSKENGPAYQQTVAITDAPGSNPYNPGSILNQEIYGLRQDFVTCAICFRIGEPPLILGCVKWGRRYISDVVTGGLLGPLGLGIKGLLGGQHYYGGQPAQYPPANIPPQLQGVL